MQDNIFLPPGTRPPQGTPEMDFIGPQVLRFQQAVQDLRNPKGY